MAKPARVRTASGTWVDLASSVTDLSSYSTTSQIASTYSPITTTGLVLITSTTASAAVSEVIFNNVFTSSYNSYLITLDNMLATSATAALYMQLRYSGTNQAAGYDIANINTDISGTSVNATNSGNDTQWQIGRRLGENNGGYRKGAGQIFLYNVGLGSNYPSMTGQYLAQEGTNRYFNNIGGDIRTAQSYDGFRVYGSAGNLTGTIKVYGIK